MGTRPYFSEIFTKENNFRDFLFTGIKDTKKKSLKMVSNVKGKNPLPKCVYILKQGNTDLPMSI